MPTEKVIAATVDRAINTARVDPDAPTEPRDERCQFDPTALAAVTALCDSGRQRDVVVDVISRSLQQRVDELDGDGTLAAMALLTRVTAGTDRRQISVENLQGDVGSGNGQP